MRVIVADDDHASRVLVRYAVKALGHECIAVGDGAEAWRALEASHADVVLSDWMMPGLDGIELCRRVRARACGAYTYFIFMTARSGRTSFMEGMHAGADDYLTKPLDLQELEVRLAVAGRVTSLHRRLIEQNHELDRLGRAAREAARNDALTGLGNRLRLAEDLEELRSRPAGPGRAHWAALCDLDFFKRFNDAYGHVAGDGALRAVAQATRGAMREGDHVYRYGGEELLVLMPDQTATGALAATDRLRRSVQGLGIAHAHNPPSGVLTVSVGLSPLQLGRGTLDGGWLEEADAALYRAKALGRNRVAAVTDVPSGAALAG